MSQPIARIDVNPTVKFEFVLFASRIEQVLTIPQPARRIRAAVHTMGELERVLPAARIAYNNDWLNDRCLDAIHAECESIGRMLAEIIAAAAHELAAR